jgi:hypothetical protein
MRKLLAVLGIIVVVCGAAAAHAGNHKETLRRMADDGLRDWASHPTIVDAVRAQNQQHRSLSADQIMGLDQRWRAERTAASQPMRQALMANVLSSFLIRKKRAADGLFTEIQVMDDKGLLVGSSDLSPDYWQGDEAKWLKTYMVGPKSIHISDGATDNSAARFQTELSLPVVDPVTRKAIGAVMIGVNAAKLRR